MKKFVAMAFALVLCMALAVPAVMADTTTKTVGTGATIGGGGNGPFICAKFETPDHLAQTGTQVNPVPGPDWNPMDRPIDDLTGWRQMKFYVVVGDPNGVDDIAAVDVTVRYPNEMEKFQLRAIREAYASGTWTGEAHYPQWPVFEIPVRVVPYDGMVDMDGDCTPDTAVPKAMQQLYAGGALTLGVDAAGKQQVLGDGTSSGVLYDIKMGKQILIELVGWMNWHQPADTYIVDAMGTDSTGNTGEKLRNYFEFLSIVSLYIDFSGVNWGPLTMGRTNWVLGDMDPMTTARPTVWNVGNDPGQLRVTNTPLVGVEHGKQILDFDVRLDQICCHTGEVVCEGYVEYPANTPTLVTDDKGNNVLLCPCNPTQIDFSVHPPIGLPSDVYKGQVTLKIEHHTGPLPECAAGCAPK